MVLSYEERNYSVEDLVNKTYNYLTEGCPTSRHENKILFQFGVKPGNMIFAQAVLDKNEITYEKVNELITEAAMDLLNSYPHYNNDCLPVDFINIHVSSDYRRH